MCTFQYLEEKKKRRKASPLEFSQLFHFHNLFKRHLSLSLSISQSKGISLSSSSSSCRRRERAALSVYARRMLATRRCSQYGSLPQSAAASRLRFSAKLSCRSPRRPTCKVRFPLSLSLSLVTREKPLEKQSEENTKGRRRKEKNSGFLFNTHAGRCVDGSVATRERERERDQRSRGRRASTRVQRTSLWTPRRVGIRTLESVLEYPKAHVSALCALEHDKGLFRRTTQPLCENST